MKTKTIAVKPWNKLTQDERVARVKAAYGKFAGPKDGVEQFLREKHEEIDREEREFQSRYPGK